MMKKKILTTIFLLFITANIFGDQVIDYEKIADNITLQTAKQLKTDQNLHACGFGGSMMDDIKVMSLSFQYQKPMDLQTSRQLIIRAMNAYLTNINSSSDLQPFLHNYPFINKNIEIAIFCTSYVEGKSSMDNLFCVSAINGKVEYNGFDDNGKRCMLFSESYEDALRIVENEENSQ